jgi:hypothetical protein
MNFNLKAAGTLLSRAKQVFCYNKQINRLFKECFLLFSLQKKNLVKLLNEQNMMKILKIY